MATKLGSVLSSPTVPLGDHRRDPQAELPLTPSASPKQNPSAVCGDTIGRYPVSGEIARGGMGVILRGHDPNLGRDLAIKVLLDPNDDPDIVRRFVEEAQIGGQLQHPGIVPVYEIGLYDESRPYFTMELVQGRTLGDLLHERTKPGQDLPRFLGIFQQVCLTMAYAHNRGVIHRDLKPGNIMVGSFGEVQVMDWGVAKVKNRGPDGTPLSRAAKFPTIHTTTGGSVSVAGMVSGTPAYMAPEQARGENDRVDTPADVFALGSMLCEILSGHPAYEGNSSEDTYRRAERSDLGEAQMWLDSVNADPQLVQLARQCLEPEPEARPRDAGMVAWKMTAYLNGVQERLRQAELERAATTARATAEQRSRRLTQTLGGLIVLTLLGLVAAGGWSYEKRARLASEVDADLTQAETKVREGKIAEARTAVERAGGRLGGGGPAALQQRWQRVRDDLAMSERLDNILLLQATVNDGRFDHEAALPEYEQAFKNFDLDVLRLDPAEAAQRLRTSALHAHLLAALDDWLLLLHDSGHSEWQQLLAVVQQADDDEPRQALRAAWAAQDWQRLRHLADPKQSADLSPSTALFVSTALLRAQASAQAVAVLEMAQRNYPHDFWLNHRLAYTLDRDTNRHEEAVGYYRAALALRPQSPGVYVNLSVVLNRLGRTAEAEDACRKAIELAPEYAEAYTNLAYFLRQRGRLREVEAPLQKALALKPRLSNAHLNLFYLREKQGRLDEAEEALRQVVNLEPHNAAAHLAYGVFLRQRGEARAATEEFQKAATLEPQSAVYHFQTAYALETAGARAEAEKEYRTVLQLDNRHALAHTNLGALLYAEGRFAEAEQEQRQAIDADPNLPSAYLNLGITLARQKKLAEAETAFNEALRLKPAFGAAYFQLALAQLRQEKNALAVSNFREALRCDQDTSDLHGRLGQALARLGQIAEAEREYRRALKKDGEQPEWLCRLGLALEEQGRFREGCALLRKGHNRGVTQPDWNLPSEKWLKSAERKVELEDRLPAVLAGTMQPKDGAEWLDYAQLCQAKQQYAGAVQCYQSAFVANPNLATDYRAGGGRVKAARVAVLAASGPGSETVAEATRARFRQQALDWLRADVRGWNRGLEASTPAFRANVRLLLESLQQDPALAPVRDAPGLEKLPETERAAFQQFWATVAALSQRLDDKKD